MQLSEIKALSPQKHRVVLKALGSVDLAEIKDEERREYARLWRRHGNYTMALKCLCPIIRNGTEKVGGTAEDIFEYARCLLELGGATEALSLLNEARMDWPKQYAYLLGYAHYESLDFEKAAQHLEKFLAEGAADSTDFQRAKLFLLRSYRILGKFEEALRLCSSDPELSQEAEYTHLVIKAISPETTSLAIELLKEERTRFEFEKKYAHLRETDLFLAVAATDARLVTKVFYGSPSSAFRDRIREASTGPLEIKESYLFSSNRDGITDRVFEMAKGIEEVNSEVTLKVGQAVHRLLSGLLADFYRPVTVIGAFHLIFKGENYNPWHSPMRVHQIVKRLKDWFAISEIPVEVVEHCGAYFLRFTGEYSFLLQKTHLDFTQKPPLFARLEALIPESTFNIRMASEALGISPRFTRKLLGRARESGWIEIHRRGCRTTYSFVKKP